VLRSILTPVGTLRASSTGVGICNLDFCENAVAESPTDETRTHSTQADVKLALNHLDRLEAELIEYFNGMRRSFSLPLDEQGTPFQRRVWQELKQIQYGETASYEAIARRIGAPRAMRAVGRSNGLNPIVLLVPCHRVINKSGQPGGYGGGIGRKLKLLKLEGAWPADRPLPTPVRARTIRDRVDRYATSPFAAASLFE
jgi:O-6-methylguanine DNA methyltransferase